RWRGQPDFGGAQWAQLTGVADRVVVDSSEWDELRYRELSEAFERTAVSDIAWSRIHRWRVALADYWPGVREQEIRVRGPRAEASLLRGWLAAQLRRAIRPVEPAGELAVRLGGEELSAPAEETRSPSARLRDDQLHGGVVPEVQALVGRDVDRALGDEAVLPEVREAAIGPRAAGKRPPAAGHVACRGGRDDRVLDARHGRHRAPRPVRP